MADSCSTRQLIERWRTGDQSAPGEIVARFSRLVRICAGGRAGCRIRPDVDASQVALDALVTFLDWVKSKPANPINDTQHAANVLRQIVRRHLHDKEMRSGREAGLDTDVASCEPALDDEVAAWDELEFMLQQCEDQEVKIIWLCLNGRSSQEIARQLGTSRHTVRRVRNWFGAWLLRRLSNHLE